VTADTRHLARAIALAEPAVVPASPNPGVGCVLVRDGQVVGEGATAAPGGPHAEIAALRTAGTAADGASAYVTLEPCAHHGRTPPCTQALRAAGVRRVVFVHPDPNPLATGGADRLRDDGITVVGPRPCGDLLRGSVGRQLEGFLSAVTRGRPHVTLKLAQTTDGALHAPDGARWLTGPAARRSVHRWRASRDAVLVGSGTVLADDPRLDVRHVPAVRQPRPVVLDSRLRTPPEAHVARPGALVLTAPAGPSPARAALVARGVEVVDVPPTPADDAIGSAPGDGLDLHAALAELSARGITSVLAEPGRTLADALVAADLVDRLVLHVASGLGDGRPRRALDPPPGRRWRAERVGGVGPDLILHLRPESLGSPEEGA
jgi:diaminohydroxyphosphoribosylaminopyrimidine deaminase / 5-amino-6-(5-phosphoribosylamino)uracil reductase